MVALCVRRASFSRLRRFCYGECSTPCARADGTTRRLLIVACRTLPVCMRHVVQYRFSHRLLAMNVAIRELRSLQMLHDSLSLVVRRSRAAKTNLIITTENIAVECIVARTGVQQINLSHKVA